MKYEPINPCTTFVPENEHQKAYNKHYIGLNKLEYFSGLALQGLLANPKIEHWITDDGNFSASKTAIHHAKELIKNLEVEQGDQRK